MVVVSTMTAYIVDYHLCHIVYKYSVMHVAYSTLDWPSNTHIIIMIIHSHPICQELVATLEGWPW